MSTSTSDRSALVAEAWVFGPALPPRPPQLHGAKRVAFAASIVVLCALAGGSLLGMSSLVLGWVRGGDQMMHRVTTSAGASSPSSSYAGQRPHNWRPERGPRRCSSSWRVPPLGAVDVGVWGHLARACRPRRSCRAGGCHVLAASWAQGHRAVRAFSHPHSALGQTPFPLRFALGRSDGV